MTDDYENTICDDKPETYRTGYITIHVKDLLVVLVCIVVSVVACYLFGIIPYLIALATGFLGLKASDWWNS